MDCRKKSYLRNFFVYLTLDKIDYGKTQRGVYVMSNKGLIAIFAVLLLGVCALTFLQMNGDNAASAGEVNIVTSPQDSDAAENKLEHIYKEYNS